MKITDDLFLEFEPEDFENYFSSPENPHLFCNKKLREFQEKMPVVLSDEGKCPNATWWEIKESGTATHKARLIGPVPIVKDTAESLLKEFVAIHPNYTGWMDDMEKIKIRAKKLLEQK